MFEVTEILRNKWSKKEIRTQAFYNHKDVLCVVSNPIGGAGARFYVCKNGFYTVVDCVESAEKVIELIKEASFVDMEQFISFLDEEKLKI